MWARTGQRESEKAHTLMVAHGRRGTTKCKCTPCEAQCSTKLDLSTDLNATVGVTGFDGTGGAGFEYVALKNMLQRAACCSGTAVLPARWQGACRVARCLSFSSLPRRHKYSCTPRHTDIGHFFYHAISTPCKSFLYERAAARAASEYAYEPWVKGGVWACPSHASSGEDTQFCLR